MKMLKHSVACCRIHVSRPGSMRKALGQHPPTFPEHFLSRITSCTNSKCLLLCLYDECNAGLPEQPRAALSAGRQADAAPDRERRVALWRADPDARRAGTRIQGLAHHAARRAGPARSDGHRAPHAGTGHLRRQGPVRAALVQAGRHAGRTGGDGGGPEDQAADHRRRPGGAADAGVRFRHGGAGLPAAAACALPQGRACTA